MQEEKQNESNGLDEGTCLMLYAIYKLLDCHHPLYGQPLPLEEPAAPECAVPRGSHGR